MGFDLRLDLWLAVALAIALAFGVVAIGSHIWREGHSADATGRRISWWIASAVVYALCVVLVVLSSVLVARVWAEVRSSAYPPTVFPLEKAASAVSGGETKDAVNNTMTAVALSITVVTLLLTLGTSWFAQARKELNRELQQVKVELKRAARQEGLNDMRELLNVSFVSARRGLYGWIRVTGTNPNLLNLHHGLLSLNLEELASDDRKIRAKAFRELVSYLDPWTDDLRPVRAYTEECHRYVLARLAHKMRIGDPAELARLDREGLACKVFDRGEVERVLGI